MSEDFSIRALGVSGTDAVHGDSLKVGTLGGKVNTGSQISLKKDSEDELVAFEGGDSAQRGTLKNPRIVIANRDLKPVQTETPKVNKANVETKKTASTEETGKTEKPKETEEPESTGKGTLDDPRIVRASGEQTNTQQAKIQSLIENIVLNGNFGRKDMEVTDNVIYEDENGNPTRQVITKENEKGEIIQLIVEYDNQGRITKISNQMDAKDNEGHVYKDGDQWNFEYLSDGTIRVTPSDAYTDQESGATANWLVQKASYIIDTDGKLYMIDVMGKKSEIPFLLPF